MAVRSVALGIVLCASLAHGQAFEHSLGNWTLLTAWGRQGNARWYAEVQTRATLNAPRFDRLILRPAVGIQVTPVVSLWIGYGWSPKFDASYREESFPWQQVLTEHHFGTASLLNRSRVEQRFISETSGPSYRLRHMVRAVIRFSEDSPWGVALFDEFFVTVNAVQNGPPAGFDQNRVFAGLNVKVDAWQFELGYMNMIFRPPSPANLRMLHNLTAMVVWNVP